MLRHGNGSSHFFRLQKLISDPRQRSNKTHLWPPEMPANSPQNIRESSLYFTARFGKNKPRHALSLQTGLSESERAVFASFPSVQREEMKKIVKSSIFCEKQINF